MIYQPAFDQDEDVLMLNPDPETAAFDDDDDDLADDGAEFDDLGSGATSGYGADDLDDIEDTLNEDDLDEDLDDDTIEDDLDDDSME
jgi:DNA-directed RNA polymerase subunit delta